MGVLQVLQLLSLALDAAASFQIDMGKFNAIRDKAHSEGRDISMAELKMLADEAQTAIDAIGPK